MTKRIVGLMLLTFGCLFFVADGYHAQLTALRSFDFKPVYSGARCLLDHCNPYNIDQIRQEYLSHGGDTRDLRSFRIYNAVYPPSALALAVPFAIFPWQPAHLLWLAVSAGILVLAAFLIADLCAPYSPLLSVSLIGLLMLTSVLLMMLAQPAMLTIGLSAIAIWCILKGRFPVLGVVCFAVSLTLKPHVGGLIWLYFLLSGSARYRLRAWQIFFVTILFCLPGIVWASLTPQSAHWMHDLQANLTGISSRGNANDPGPTNIEASANASFQAVVSLFRDDPHVYNPVTWSFIGFLLLLWLYTTVKMRPSLRKDFLGLASIACLSLLPIYHREYDTRILLLTFPALALLVSEGGVAGTVGLILSPIAIVVTSSPFSKFLNDHYFTHHPRQGFIITLVFMREIPLAMLGMGLFYLLVYVSEYRKEAERRSLEPLGQGSLANAT